MMDRCSSCPEEAALQEYLIELTTEEDDGISKKMNPDRGNQIRNNNGR
jgi:hypothetical protein